MEPPIKTDSDMITLSMLGRRNLIFGPPGTGKTTAIERLLAEYKAMHGIEDASRCKPSFPYYVTYSRWMAGIARRRMRVGRAHMGTMHSIFTQLLGWEKRNFLTEDEVTAFCAKYNILKMREVRSWDDESDEGEPDEWSKFISAYDRAKQQVPRTQLTPMIEDRTRDWDRIAKQYDIYKQSLGKADYTDIIVTVAAQPAFLPATDILFIDEAQDLTPLMHRVILEWEKRASLTVLAGDDDQSIYGFRGVSVDDFLSWRDESKIFHLTRTHRYGLNICKAAERVLSGVSEREKKDVQPTKKDDTVQFATSLSPLLSSRGGRFILCRTRQLCRTIAAELNSSGVVYRSVNPRHSGISPWSSRLIDLVSVLHKWNDGTDPDSIEDMQTLCSLLPAEVMIRGRKTQIMKGVIDTQTNIENYGGNSIFQSLFRRRMTPARFLELCSLTKTGKDLARRHYRRGISDDDIIRLDTIHASKGGESGTVALVIDIPDRIQGSFSDKHIGDEERRIFHVGATRASDRLIVTWLGIYDYAPVGLWELQDYTNGAGNYEREIMTGGEPAS